MFYLLGEPTLGDMLQYGSKERAIFANIDFKFWLKVAIFLCVFSFVMRLVLRPSKEAQDRRRKMNENIRRNKSRVFGGGSDYLTHMGANPNYKQGGCRNGCGSCIVHGCTKKDNNGELILKKDGKPETHYNARRCVNCKNNSWCICCTGEDK